MTKGFQSFKDWFDGFENQYVIIGGTACEILMAENDVNFRATKDIDLVLILESLSTDFGMRFWDYIKMGGYEHKNRSTGKTQFYRFSKPRNNEYPAMIEIFSRKIDGMILPKEAILEPLHVGDEISSLSAILLDEEYYNFIVSGRLEMDGISVLGPEYIIPLKINAWIDLTKKRQEGKIEIDSKSIKKHKNDVFRLSEILIKGNKVVVSQHIYDDINTFIEKMKNEDVNLKQIGIIGRTKDEILSELKEIYVLENLT